MPSAIGNNTQCLFWDIGNAKWTTEEAFTPLSDSGTVARQWFVLPPAVKFVSANTYCLSGRIQISNITTNPQGGGRIYVKSENASFAPTWIDIDSGGKLSYADTGAFNYDETTTSQLLTDALTRYPYVKIQTINYVFIPCVNFQMLAGGSRSS